MEESESRESRQLTLTHTTTAGTDQYFCKTRRQGHMAVQAPTSALGRRLAGRQTDGSPNRGQPKRRAREGSWSIFSRYPLFAVAMRKGVVIAGGRKGFELCKETSAIGSGVKLRRAAWTANA